MKRNTVIHQRVAYIARRHRPHPFLVVIDGFAAAGKTTLADERVNPLQRLRRHVIRVSMDHCHSSAPIVVNNNDVCRPTLRLHPLPTAP